MRRFQFGWWTAALLVLVGSALVAEAQTKAAPQGYGKAQFGMNVEQVQRLYPDMQLAPKVAGYLSHPDLQRYVLWHQKLEGIKKPVDIELRFWKNTLWMLLFYCNDNDFKSVEAQLTKQYGEPAGIGENPNWLWPNRTLVTRPRQKWFSIADRQIGKDAQALLAPQAGAPLPQTKLPPSGETKP